MFKIKSQVQFDMAHYLSGYNGKCANIHGHRYTLIATLASKKLQKEGQLRGMVDDFSNFKAVLKEIGDIFDHKFILEDNEEGRTLANKLADMPNNFEIYLPKYKFQKISSYIYELKQIK